MSSAIHLPSCGEVSIFQSRPSSRRKLVMTINHISSRRTLLAVMQSLLRLSFGPTFRLMLEWRNLWTFPRWPFCIKRLILPHATSVLTTPSPSPIHFPAPSFLSSTTFVYTAGQSFHFYIPSICVIPSLKFLLLVFWLLLPSQLPFPLLRTLLLEMRCAFKYKTN